MIDRGDLRSHLHRTVAEKLSEHLRSLNGDQPLSLDDERALTRSLIAAELRLLAEDAYRNGETPMDPAEEAELGEAVFDRVHGLGRLQPYIDDPDIANIHINGHDNVWLVYRDGSKVRGEPAAESDRWARRSRRAGIASSWTSPLRSPVTTRPPAQSNTRSAR